MKTNYDYPSKARMRQELKKSIGRWVPNKADARVVCFPGAEAREIYEVYDALGIPRQNIIGIERDKSVYQALGIQLWNGEARDFFSQRGEFDVVSLDYTQLPSLETIGIVRKLFKDSMLANRALLYTNFYAQRINDFCKTRLPFIHRYNTNYIYDGEVKKAETHVGRMTWDVASKQLGVSFRDFRSDALTQLLINCSKSSDSRFIDEIILSSETGSLTEVLKKNSGDFEFINVKKPIVPFVQEPYANPPGGRTFRCNNFGLSALSDVACYTDDAGLPFNRDYFVDGISRFEYVSDDGSLMFSDIMQVSRGDEIIGAFLGSFKGLSMGRLPGQLPSRKFYNPLQNRPPSLVPKGENERAFARNKKIIERCADEWFRRSQGADRILARLPPRIDITPPKITKEEAVDLFRNGHSVNDVHSQYRGFSRGQLAAIKAHLTMGTYDEQQPVQKDLSVEETRNVKILSDGSNKVFGKGVVLYDSDHNRMRRNGERIVSPVSINLVSNLRKVGIFRGLDWHISKNRGLYILNGFDNKLTDALDLVLNHSLESPYYHNLLFIGEPGDFVLGEIGTANSLGAKIRLANFGSTAYIDPQKRVSLDEVIQRALNSD